MSARAYKNAVDFLGARLQNLHAKKYNNVRISRDPWRPNLKFKFGERPESVRSCVRAYVPISDQHTINVDRRLSFCVHTCMRIHASMYARADYSIRLTTIETINTRVIMEPW